MPSHSPQLNRKILTTNRIYHLKRRRRQHLPRLYEIYTLHSRLIRLSTFLPSVYITSKNNSILNRATRTETHQRVHKFGKIVVVLIKFYAKYPVPTSLFQSTDFAPSAGNLYKKISHIVRPLFHSYFCCFPVSRANNFRL